MNKKSFKGNVLAVPVVWAFLTAMLFYPGFVSAQEDPMDQLRQYIESMQDRTGSDFATLNRAVLAKAKPDECFYGIGDAENLFVPTGIDCDACTADDGTPKVNQAYVWGLAKAGANLWFGTAPNVHCLVMSGYLGIDNALQNGSFVCEFGDNTTGDWRPPRLYAYNTITKKLEDKTPADARINATVGIRSAGALGDVVFLAGPAFRGGINLFAFNTKTGAYIGSANLTNYNNIRKWRVIENVLYTAVGVRGGGRVLRWKGDVVNPFQFEEVGELDGDGAEIALHENRIFVSTWPAGGAVAGLYMSPEIPEGGLTAGDTKWEKVWEATDYEPDPVTALTYGGGALASFDGYLYWGTMHVPMLSALAHSRFYNYEADQQDVLMALIGTYRSISIFRGRNFSGSFLREVPPAEPEIQLVYGMPRLPVFSADETGGQWVLRDNEMGGAMPLYGPSGFGNPFNNYTWTMDVFHDQLFVGTMDWSYLMFGQSEAGLPEDLPFDCDQFQFPGVTCEQMEEVYDQFVEAFDPTRLFGADLFKFTGSDSPAIPESLAGVGNYTSYGIRTMISAETLYLGMANPMNLLTDPTDDIPEGGWELIRLGLRGDIDGDGDVDANDLSLLLSHLNGTAGDHPYSDLTGDGMITVLDVRQIVAENPILARDTRVRRLLR